MSQSATQQKASLFAIGGKRAQDIIGSTYGTFTVVSYVGKDASSEWVNLSHSCGATLQRRRRELHRVAKQTYCNSCLPRPKARSEAAE